MAGGEGAPSRVLSSGAHGQPVVGFGGGPRGLAVVARNRVLVGEPGRIEKGWRALFRDGNGERGSDSPAHGSSGGGLGAGGRERRAPSEMARRTGSRSLTSEGDWMPSPMVRGRRRQACWIMILPIFLFFYRSHLG
jgi:hypothetical protein